MKWAAVVLEEAAWGTDDPELFPSLRDFLFMGRWVITNAGPAYLKPVVNKLQDPPTLPSVWLQTFGIKLHKGRKPQISVRDQRTLM